MSMTLWSCAHVSVSTALMTRPIFCICADRTPSCRNSLSLTMPLPCRHVVPCRHMWCQVAICGATSPYVVPCRHMWCHVVICGAMSPYGVPCRHMWCHVAMCGAMSPYVVPCGALSCHVAVWCRWGGRGGGGGRSCGAIGMLCVAMAHPSS